MRKKMKGRRRQYLDQMRSWIRCMKRMERRKRVVVMDQWRRDVWRSYRLLNPHFSLFLLSFISWRDEVNNCFGSRRTTRKTRKIRLGPTRWSPIPQQPVLRVPQICGPTKTRPNPAPLQTFAGQTRGPSPTLPSLNMTLEMAIMDLDRGPDP